MAHSLLSGWSMDFLKPNVVADQMVELGEMKSKLSPKHALLRGFLAGAILSFATSLAVVATIQSGIPLVGALVFPVGFVIIVLLGLELVTGNFALIPAAWMHGRATVRGMLTNWGWVFLGNLLGSIFYGGLLWMSLTQTGAIDPPELAARLRSIAEAKTTGFEAHGAQGMATVIARAILCNWMVCLGVIIPLCSRAAIGKIAGAWLPIFIFFAQGYEHAVVNMFVIPAGMMLGADITMGQWWLWNQIPVTIGNVLGGAIFVGFAIVITHGTKSGAEALAVTPIGPVSEGEEEQ